MAASVVDLPEPVMPVTSTRPRGIVADLLHDLRHVELVERADLGGNHAQDHADVAALLEDVHAEASQAGDAVGHVELGILLEFLFLPVGHHAERHAQHVFGGDARLFGERDQFAVNAHVRVVADLQVQVGRLPVHGNAQQFVNLHGSFPAELRVRPERITERAQGSRRKAAAIPADGALKPKAYPLNGSSALPP